MFFSHLFYPCFGSCRIYNDRKLLFRKIARHNLFQCEIVKIRSVDHDRSFDKLAYVYLFGCCWRWIEYDFITIFADFSNFNSACFRIKDASVQCVFVLTFFRIHRCTVFFKCHKIYSYFLFTIRTLPSFSNVNLSPYLLML